MNNIFLEPVMYVLVTGGQNLKTNAGADYWKIEVITAIEKAKKIELKIWDSGPKPDENPNLPQKGDYLKIIIEDLEYFENEYLSERGKFSATIQGKNNKNTWSKISKLKIPEEYLNLLVNKCASSKQIKNAWSIINLKDHWENEENYNFIMSVLDKIGREKIEEAPAAKSKHHNYKGGLLVHTSEVLKSVTYNVISKQPHYNFINYDVVCGAAILHDVGKIKTFSCNELNIADSSEDEILIGHPFFSMFYFQKIAEEIGFNNNDYILEVLHCIASHHGKTEWGAIVEGKTPEAQILHHADHESSSIEHYKDSLLRTTGNQKIIKEYSNKIYITYKARKMLQEGEININ